MSMLRISYSQELQDVVAQRHPGTVHAAVLDAVAVLDGRFGEVRLSPASAAAEEGAEVSADGTTLGLTVLPRRFADPNRLTQFLRHELGHLADILDQTFGYGATPDGLAITPALRRGCKLLWACSVDGRTAQRGGVPLHSSEEYVAEFARRFPNLRPAAVRDVVKGLWHEERQCYACLMRMAADFSAEPAPAPAAAGPLAPERRVRYAPSPA